MPEPEWVTVAQAAQLLGVAERQARRIADRLPDYDKRSEAGQGGRQRLMLRVAAIEKAAAAPARSADAAGEDRTPAGQPTGQMMFAAERIIAEKDARIASLEATQTQLLEALKLAQENLSREQTLRALPAPEANESEARPPLEAERGKRRWWQWPRKEPEDK